MADDTQNITPASSWAVIPFDPGPGTAFSVLLHGALLDDYLAWVLDPRGFSCSQGVEHHAFAVANCPSQGLAAICHYPDGLAVPGLYRLCLCQTKGTNACAVWEAVEGYLQVGDVDLCGNCGDDEQNASLSLPAYVIPIVAGVLIAVILVVMCLSAPRFRAKLRDWKGRVFEHVCWRMEKQRMVYVVGTRSTTSDDSSTILRDQKSHVPSESHDLQASENVRKEREPRGVDTCPPVDGQGPRVVCLQSSPATEIQVVSSAVHEQLVGNVPEVVARATEDGATGEEQCCGPMAGSLELPDPLRGSASTAATSIPHVEVSLATHREVARPRRPQVLPQLRAPPRLPRATVVEARGPASSNEAAVGGQAFVDGTTVMLWKGRRKTSPGDTLLK